MNDYIYSRSLHSSGRPQTPSQRPESREGYSVSAHRSSTGMTWVVRDVEKRFSVSHWSDGVRSAVRHIFSGKIWLKTRLLKDHTGVLD